MIVLYGNLRLWLNTRDFIPSPGLGLILFNTYGGFFYGLHLKVNKLI